MPRSGSTHRPPQWSGPPGSSNSRPAQYPYSPPQDSVPSFQRMSRSYSQGRYQRDSYIDVDESMDIEGEFPDMEQEEEIHPRPGQPGGWRLPMKLARPRPQSPPRRGFVGGFIRKLPGFRKGKQAPSYVESEEVEDEDDYPDERDDQGFPVSHTPTSIYMHDVALPISSPPTIRTDHMESILSPVSYRSQHLSHHSQTIAEEGSVDDDEEQGQYDEEDEFVDIPQTIPSHSSHQAPPRRPLPTPGMRMPTIHVEEPTPPSGRSARSSQTRSQDSQESSPRSYTQPSLHSHSHSHHSRATSRSRRDTRQEPTPILPPHQPIFVAPSDGSSSDLSVGGHFRRIRGIIRDVHGLPWMSQRIAQEYHPPIESARSKLRPDVRKRAGLPPTPDPTHVVQFPPGTGQPSVPLAGNDGNISGATRTTNGPEEQTSWYTPSPAQQLKEQKKKLLRGLKDSSNTTLAYVPTQAGGYIFPFGDPSKASMGPVPLGSTPTPPFVYAPGPQPYPFQMAAQPMYMIPPQQAMYPPPGFVPAPQPQAQNLSRSPSGRSQRTHRTADGQPVIPVPVSPQGAPPGMQPMYMVPAYVGPNGGPPVVGPGLGNATMPYAYPPMWGGPPQMQGPKSSGHHTPRPSVQVPLSPTSQPGG